MELKDRVARQVAEAMGSVNRYYCSKYYGYEVTDPEILLAYYIKNGGAEHFAKSCRSPLTEDKWMLVVHGIDVCLT